jgi:hypothetical protein
VRPDQKVRPQDIEQDRRIDRGLHPFRGLR